MEAGVSVELSWRQDERRKALFSRDDVDGVLGASDCAPVRDFDLRGPLALDDGVAAAGAAGGAPKLPPEPEAERSTNLPEDGDPAKGGRPLAPAIAARAFEMGSRLALLATLSEREMRGCR